MADKDTSLVPVFRRSQGLNKTTERLDVPAARRLAVVQSAAAVATERYIPHVSLDDVQRLSSVAASTGWPAKRERNVLIIQCLFDSCLRVSELLALRPKDIELVYMAYYLRVWNQKRRRYETCNITAPMATKLQSYAYRHKIEPDDRLFKINRTRVFQMIAETFRLAGIVKPDGVGTVHILRHSGALERLRQTRNPQSVQEQLRHASMSMTMRYMRTLGHDEAMAIQSEVKYDW